VSTRNLIGRILWGQKWTPRDKYSAARAVLTAVKALCDELDLRHNQRSYRIYIRRDLQIGDQSL
jgi:hypothetical protein